MRRLLTILLLLSGLTAHALTYSREDSIRVVQLLEQGKQQSDDLIGFYAQQLIGTPSVAATLEVNPREELVVNLRQLDCTTLVETVLALALTTRQGSTEFDRYCQNLTKIRYNGGTLDGYPSRNHYFTWWIDSNETQGIVHEITPPEALCATQNLDLHYMSAHPAYYPMLKDDTQAQSLIRQHEQASNGRQIKYIPRARLNQAPSSALGCIKDGDILAIVTRKDGLDTSHIGFAKWGTDNRLHLLNASQIHKRVVLEPMTLYEYMGKHPSQLGIRVIRPIL